MMIKSYHVAIQMKAIEQCLPVVLFIMLYKVNEIQKGFPLVWFYYAVQGGSNF